MDNVYRLFFRQIELGQVTQTEADFPSLLGTFQANALGPGELCRHLEDYQAYCLAADALIQTGGEAAWEQYVAENESQFLDLIETEDWSLREGEDSTPILVPNFCQNHEIVWRWNLARSPEGSAMARIILRGWMPGSEQRLIPLVKALREHLACSMGEAVEIAADCTDLGNTVIREDIPLPTARRLFEELRSQAFDSDLEE